MRPLHGFVRPCFQADVRRGVAGWYLMWLAESRPKKKPSGWDRDGFRRMASWLIPGLGAEEVDDVDGGIDFDREGP